MGIDSKEVIEEYGFELVEKPQNNYDAIIVAVGHKEYLEFDEEYIPSVKSGQQYNFANGSKAR